MNSQFVMELKHVKNQVEKKKKKLDTESLFDYNFKEGGKVKMGKKVKKERENRMDMSVYNVVGKGHSRYKRDNN